MNKTPLLEKKNGLTTWNTYGIMGYSNWKPYQTLWRMGYSPYQHHASLQPHASFESTFVWHRTASVPGRADRGGVPRSAFSSPYLRQENHGNPHMNQHFRYKLRPSYLFVNIRGDYPMIAPFKPVPWFVKDDVCHLELLHDSLLKSRSLKLMVSTKNISIQYSPPKTATRTCAYVHIYIYINN